MNDKLSDRVSPRMRGGKSANPNQSLADGLEFWEKARERAISAVDNYMESEEVKVNGWTSAQMVETVFTAIGKP